MRQRQRQTTSFAQRIARDTRGNRSRAHAGWGKAGGGCGRQRITVDLCRLRKKLHTGTLGGASLLTQRAVRAPQRVIDYRWEPCYTQVMTKSLLLLAGICLGTQFTPAATYTVHTFKKIVLTDDFWCEGANIGDFNHDGKMDVAAGPFWWEGPDFKVRHEYRDASKTSKIKQADGTEITIPGLKGAKGH